MSHSLFSLTYLFSLPSIPFHSIPFWSRRLIQVYMIISIELRYMKTARVLHPHSTFKNKDVDRTILWITIKMLLSVTTIDFMQVGLKLKLGFKGIRIRWREYKLMNTAHKEEEEGKKRKSKFQGIKKRDNLLFQQRTFFFGI